MCAPQSAFLIFKTSPPQMAQSNPMLAQMLQQNPELRTQLGSPEFLQRVWDPANIQAISQLQASGLLPNYG